jgi:membrane-bound inhibitor of C-type lysozyme
MKRYRTVLAAIAGTMVGIVPAVAQNTTFQGYHCADDTHFIVAFYPHDPSAYVQIDGDSVILRQRLAISGKRYSGGGVTLKFNRAGAISVKRTRRPETACELG